MEQPNKIINVCKKYEQKHKLMKYKMKKISVVSLTIKVFLMTLNHDQDLYHSQFCFYIQSKTI